MTALVELPGADGKIIAVNPHHVTGCQPYIGYLAGRTDRQEMTAVWVQDHNVYICAWRIEQVLDVLNTARRAIADAFAAGYRAALGPTVAVDAERMERRFRIWADGETEEADGETEEAEVPAS